MSSTAQPARPPVKRSAHMTGVANASVSWNFSMESQEKGPFWRICLLGIPGDCWYCYCPVCAWQELIDRCWVQGGTLITDSHTLCFVQDMEVDASTLLQKNHRSNLVISPRYNL